MTHREGSTAPKKPEAKPDAWGESPPLSDEDRAWLREKVLRRIRRFT